MSNPSMPNIPGMGAMTDTLDFVKNLWSGMSIPGMNMPGMAIPGMVMPTVSVEEINKQISDLKAVESWLTLNMNMLRSTIQALEVQSATISALQSMSEAMSSAVKPTTVDKTAPISTPVQPAAQAPASAPDEVKSKAAPEKPATSSDTAGASAPLTNPAIWWNMLQDQFKQAVNTAMASEKPAGPAKADKAVAEHVDNKPPSAPKAAPRSRKTPKNPEK